MNLGRRRGRLVQLLLLGVMAASLVVPGIGASAQVDDHDLDPIRTLPLPCEAIGAPGSVTTRSSNNLVHIANHCGIVGTDVEFQSRQDADGELHDYAFLGTIGGGLRIFDITDPYKPTPAGAFFDTAYQGDVQIRGDRATITVDAGTSTGACLTGNINEGVDILRLNYDSDAAATGPLNHFNPTLVTCIANEPGGAHTNTLHPSGKWLAISNPSDYSVDVIDLRKLDDTCTSTAPCDKLHTYRMADERYSDDPGTCPAPRGGASCKIVKRPPAGSLGSSNSNVPNGRGTFSQCADAPPRSACGLFRPHDIFFSPDGKTMYVAALNSTFIMNVSNVLNGGFSTTSIIPNIACPDKGFGGCGSGNAQGLANVHNIFLSHQADTTADGKILVIADERGGGVTETGCNTSSPAEEGGGALGGLHYWALRPMGHPRSGGATPSNPKRLGAYFNPNPLIGPDELQDEFEELQLLEEEQFRAERACTVHVFRIGGNGSSSPGPAVAGLDGVSRLGPRVMASAYYGAGTWEIRIGGPTNHNTDIDDFGTREDARSTWANTMGWNVQAGADTWSSKEYKGFIYTGDILRGFDVFACGTLLTNARACPSDPVVALIKTGPATAKRGETIQYTIEYDNGGPADSQNAKIVDSLPGKTSFVSASDGGTFNSSTRKVTWKLGTVPALARDSVTLKLKVASTATTGSVLLNTATFTGDLTYSNPAAASTTVVP